MSLVFLVFDTVGTMHTGIDLSKQDRIYDSLLYCKSVQWHIIFSICQVRMYMFEICYFHSVLNNSPNIVSFDFAMHC